MFKVKINRNQDSNSGGGNAPASGGQSSPAPSSSSPATAATSGDTGGAKSVFESFQNSLAKALTKGPDSSQPPSNGKNTDSAATEDEGEGLGQLDTTKEPVTTAESEGETLSDDEQEGDNKKGWTEDELKDLKARGLDKIPFTEETRKLENSFREARAEMSRLASSNANMVTRNADLEAALHSGDVKALQNMGFDLKVDQRTPDVMIQEIETQFNEVKGAIEPLYKELISENPEIAHALKRSFDKIAGKYNERAAIIMKEQERQALKAEIYEETGHKPSTKNSYQKISDQAEKNLTALTQKDPEAGKYYNEIKDLTSNGGPLAALGINLATIYGKSPATAELANRLGKGLHFEKEMKNILATERKKWEKDYVKKSMTHGGNGGQPNHANSGSGNNSINRLRQGMQSMMGKS